MFVSLFCSCDQMSLIEFSYYASNQYPIITDYLWCLVWHNDKWWVALYYFRHKMCEKCTEMAKMTLSAKKFSPCGRVLRPSRTHPAMRLIFAVNTEMSFYSYIAENIHMSMLWHVNSQTQLYMLSYAMHTITIHTYIRAINVFLLS